jgi:hypothetical protein
MSAGVKLIFNMFDNHFTEYHTDMMACAEYYMEDSFKYLTEDVLNGKCRRESGLRKLLLKGAQFFPTIVSTITNKAHFWVYFYGSKEATKNYNCIIKLYGGPDNEEFIYNGPPRSLEESKEEVLEGHCGLIISLDQAKRIVSEKKMKFSVKISCPKQEAMDDDVQSGISDNDQN